MRMTDTHDEPLEICCPDCGDQLLSLDGEYYIGEEEPIEEHEERTDHDVLSFKNYTQEDGEFRLE